MTSIVMQGNLSDGYRAVGPFESRDEAAEWCFDRATSDDTWVLTLRVAFGAEPPGPGDEPHAILCGDLFEGFCAIGPFRDFDAADSWALKLQTTWIMPIEPPEGK
jgi:hypothetical protein